MRSEVDTTVDSEVKESLFKRCIKLYFTKEGQTLWFASSCATVAQGGVLLKMGSALATKWPVLGTAAKAVASVWSVIWKFVVGFAIALKDVIVAAFHAT